MGILSVVSSVLGALTAAKGLRDKPKERSPRDNLLSQARGAREAAEKYGFNPLTMLQYGQTGASTGLMGGTPPLASIEALTGNLAALDREVSGDADRDRAAKQLELELARVKLDQLKAGAALVQRHDHAADGVGRGPSPLGRRAATVGTPAGGAVRRTRMAGSLPTGGASDNPDDPYHERKVEKLSNTGGVIEIQNTWTGGEAVSIPGDGGEPWGVDELATAVIIGAPQVAGSAINRAVFGGKRVDRWVKEKRAENKAAADKRQAEHDEDQARRKADYDKLYTKLNKRKPGQMRRGPAYKEPAR